MSESYSKELMSSVNLYSSISDISNSRPAVEPQTPVKSFSQTTAREWSLNLAVKCKAFLENILSLSLKTDKEQKTKIKENVQQLINGEITLNIFLINVNNLLGLQFKTDVTLSDDDEKGLTYLRWELILGRLSVLGTTPPPVSAATFSSTHQQLLASCFDERVMPQLRAGNTSRLSADKLFSSVESPHHQNNKGLSSPNGHQHINLTQHKSESKEAGNVEVLLIDSDSETDRNFKPTVAKCTPKSESCDVLNRHPKFLLNYSIPVSDSESEEELNNKVNGTSVKPSSQLNTNLADSDDHKSRISNHSKVVTVEDHNARRELTEEHSFSSQEIEKISHKTTITSKKRSNTCLEQNQSKSLTKSPLKSCKEKLGRSSELVEINDPSNSHNSTDYISKRKNIFDKSANSNQKESALESMIGETNKTEESTNNLSSKNDEKSSKNSSNQLRNMLIKNLLHITEKSFTEQNTFSDQETKKSRKQKRKSEKVSLGGVIKSKSNAATPLKTCRSGGTPAKQTVPCEGSSLRVTLADKNNFQEHLFSPMTGELVCAVCRSWMASVQVHFCECKLVCTACSSSTKLCEDCGLDFAEDKRFSKFHERLSRWIGRPCVYQTAGCTSFVKPGDEHESSCEFKPFFCFKCNKEMSNVTTVQHFESEHHLTGKNYDVKIRDFYLNPVSGKLEVCCLPSRKQLVYLILNKSEEGENAQFLVNSGCDNDVSVKLVFTKKNSVFRYECDNKISNNNDEESYDRSGLTFIDVSKEAINYWFRDECVLDISVRSRFKKRKDEKNSCEDQIRDCEQIKKQNGILEKHTSSDKKKRRLQ